jgi:hypothetical protein
MERFGWDQRGGRAAATMQRVVGANGYGGAQGGGDGFFVPVLSKTDFSFDGRASGTQQAVKLAVGIDTVPWVSGVLVVRLHTKNTWSATATMSVQVANVSLVPEDPSVLFASTSALATASFTNASTAPSLNVQTIPSGFAAMVQVALTWDQGATAGTSQQFSISLDLIGRPA